MRDARFSTFDDITVSRHRDAKASNEANARIRNSKSEDRAAVWALATRLGEFTSKEIALRLDKPLNAISGRISELKAAGLIRETEYRRDRCAVLRVVRRGQPTLF